MFFLVCLFAFGFFHVGVRHADVGAIVLDDVEVDGFEQVDQHFDDSLFFQKFLYHVLVVVHFAQLVLRRFEPFSQIVTETQEFNHILEQQFQQDIFLFSDHPINCHSLKDLDSLTQEGNNRKYTIILPLLNKINFGELEVIFLFVLI